MRREREPVGEVRRRDWRGGEGGGGDWGWGWGEGSMEGRRVRVWGVELVEMVERGRRRWPERDLGSGWEARGVS